MIYKYLFPFCSCLFILLWFPSLCRNLNLMYTHWFIFAFVAIAFGVDPKIIVKSDVKDLTAYVLF